MTPSPNCSGLASCQASQNSCDRNVTIARHKSIEMLRVYCRDAELFVGNAATGLLWRACLHDRRIIERQRGGVLGVALDRSVADVRKCPFHDLRIRGGSSNVIETAEEENRSGNCAENGN